MFRPFEGDDIADLFISPDDTYVYIIKIDNVWYRRTEDGEVIP